MAVAIEERTATEIVLNYMLFAGAIFQLVCIFAVILIPQSAAEKVDDMVASTVSETQPPAPAHKPSHDHSSRKPRKERKKHR